MSKWLWGFIAIAFLSVLLLLTNMFLTTLPDWLVRTSGILALLSILGITFNLVKLKLK